MVSMRLHSAACEGLRALQKYVDFWSWSVSQPLRIET